MPLIGSLGAVALRRIKLGLIAAALLALVALGLRLGYGLGKSRGADQMLDLTRQNAELRGQLAAARQLANDNAGNLLAVRAMLGRELAQRQALQQAATDALATRGERIAALARAAARKQSLLRQATTDDQTCAALRDLPVCAAVADRLWGDLAAAGAH
jgi:hypothetical protein